MTKEIKRGGVNKLRGLAALSFISTSILAACDRVPITIGPEFEISFEENPEFSWEKIDSVEPSNVSNAEFQIAQFCVDNGLYMHPDRQIGVNFAKARVDFMIRGEIVDADEIYVLMSVAYNIAKEQASIFENISLPDNPEELLQGEKLTLAIVNEPNTCITKKGGGDSLLYYEVVTPPSGASYEAYCYVGHGMFSIVEDDSLIVATPSIEWEMCSSLDSKVPVYGQQLRGGPMYCQTFEQTLDITVVHEIAHWFAYAAGVGPDNYLSEEFAEVVAEEYTNLWIGPEPQTFE